MPLRCLIVDDSTVFLEAASVLLEREGVEVVGVAGTSAEALQQVEKLRPDVTLVDIDLGAESGFDLVQRLTFDAVRTPSNVILISMYPQEDFADMIEASSAVGFVSKTDLSAQAIYDVLESK